MTEKDNQSQFENNDDWLRNAIDDAVEPSGSHLEDDFADLDKDQEWRQQVTVRKEEILNYLGGRTPSIDRLAADLASAKIAGKAIDIDELERIIQEKYVIASETDAGAGEPRTFDLAHLDEILGSISIIATRSLFDRDPRDEFWATKAGAQASVYLSPLLTDQDKLALIDAANHFIDGPSFDPSDPVQYAAAQAELGWEDAQETHETAEAHKHMNKERIAALFAERYGIDTKSQDYTDFNAVMEVAFTTEDLDAKHLLIDKMELLGIPPEGFIEVIKQVSEENADPDGKSEGYQEK